MYGQITGCRICGSEWLEVLLELGTQFLTGVFPRSPDESLTKGPLTLVRCDECGLVQLLYSYERTELYGAHYAYRSALNRTMVNHLEAKAHMLMRTVDLRPDDVTVDVAGECLRHDLPRARRVLRPHADQVAGGQGWSHDLVRGAQ